MASLITPQFERYVAEQTIARGTVQFDEFIFANIPGLNENNLAQYLTMPTSAQIVHRQAVSQSGVINENAVVYSVTIGTEVGDFDFNFIGLVNRSKNLLAVAVQTDTVKKIRNKNAVQGNSITRNILLEFSGAKTLTGINVNANTWQIDFTVRLHGLDEKNRLTNRDLYGRAVFFDDSFLVKRKTGNQFTIQPGTAYVEGVRMDLGAEHHLTANSLPCSIYADVVHHCTVTGEYQTEIKYLTQSKADYVDTANRQHYVQILADIDSQGNVTDRRLLSPFLGMNPLTLDDTTENTKDNRGHTHKLPIASLVKKGIVKLFSGYDSDAEDMAATPKAIKGLKALIDAITRNFGNYIPNSKKSSAVNSNSAETVATSAAVKTVYDLANSKQSPATTLAGYGINNFKVENGSGNMNDYRTDGIYCFDTLYGVSNSPRDTNSDIWSGNLQVITGGIGNERWCRQIFHVHYSKDTYIRWQVSVTNDDWSAWEKLNDIEPVIRALGTKANISHTHTANQITDFNQATSQIINDAITYQKIGNFEVRKYPDGTMIQTYFVDFYDVFGANSGLGGTGRNQLTWAMSFVGKPLVWGNITSSFEDYHDVGVNILTKSTGTTLYWYNYEHGHPDQGACRLQFLAIGRWK